uniref:Uncharacterized protein n=1 Tax=Setaria italica TaxID=4555 RepID=K3Z315_SETIT
MGMWFFLIDHPVLTSIPSRPFMHMYMMTIRSKSILSCVVPFQLTLMAIVYIYIIHSHLLQKLKPWSFSVWKNN